jgi:cytochrome P450
MELLRYDSSVQMSHRVAVEDFEVEGRTIRKDELCLLLNGAANRDPRQYDCPHDFDIDRDGVRTHIAFGRGNHSCPGGPLARVEGRISIERILDRMHDIRLSEEHHGPVGNRTFRYEPTWILRGLSDLHLEWTPA